MRRILAIFVLTFVAGPLSADEPTIAELTRRVEELERRGAATDKKLDAILAAVQARPAVPMAPPAVYASVTPAPVKRASCGCENGCACNPFQSCGSSTCPSSARAAPTVTQYRAPQGHTHTCPRCGTTWDHAANPGHNCPRCGTAQFEQDPTPRRVATGVNTQKVTAPQQQYYYQQPPVTTYYYPTNYSLGNCSSGGYSSGCVNGSCGTLRR